MANRGTVPFSALHGAPYLHHLAPFWKRIPDGGFLLRLCHPCERNRGHRFGPFLANMQRTGCYHFATQLHGTEGNRAVLNGAALVYFPRFYGVIGIRRDGLGRYSANCKSPTIPICEGEGCAQNRPLASKRLFSRTFGVTLLDCMGCPTSSETRTSARSTRLIIRHAQNTVRAVHPRHAAPRFRPGLTGSMKLNTLAIA